VHGNRGETRRATGNKTGKERENKKLTTRTVHYSVEKRFSVGRKERYCLSEKWTRKGIKRSTQKNSHLEKKKKIPAWENTERHAEGKGNVHMQGKRVRVLLQEN